MTRTHTQIHHLHSHSWRQLTGFKVGANGRPVMSFYYQGPDTGKNRQLARSIDDAAPF
jgi:hypothetical protein